MNTLFATVFICVTATTQFAALASAASPAPADSSVSLVKPALSEERVILHATVGDLVLALYPSVAPKHVAQILKMARAGVFDGASFTRLEQGFVLQLANYDTREIPLTAEQRSSVEKIPAEFSSIRHVRGILSMARYDEPDSAEASFSILLGEAAHLDHQYTVFGELIDGQDVLAMMEKTPVDKEFVPLGDLTVVKADVVTTSEMSQVKLQGPVRPSIPSEKGRTLFLLLAGGLFFLTVATPIYKTVFS